MPAIEFIVDHDHTYAGDDGEEQLVGDIRFVIQTRPGDFRARGTGPTPRAMNFPARTAYLGIDGHLHKSRTDPAPFELVANDPIFNLEHITYRADFNLTTAVGIPVEVPPVYFPAPSTATTLQLTKVMADPSQPVMEVRTKGYAEDILDVTPSGISIVTGDATDALRTIGALGLVQAAKNPDLLVVGAITLDGNDLITSAAVAWPDGSPGTLTITSRDVNSAVLAYKITYGSPVTKTFTQPTITRNANSVATNVPAIAVS